MTIKVMIRREVPGNKENELKPFFEKLRAEAMQQQGYISGEILNRIDKPGENLIVSVWQSADDWRKWVINNTRKEIQEKIDNILGKETRYEIYDVQ